MLFYLRKSTRLNKLLLRVEKSVGKIGLKMSAGETKYMAFNNNGEAIKTSDDTELEEVNSFKYLGVWSTEKDIKFRKAAAWRACDKLTKT